MPCQPYYDFLIVGAGFSGATLAERLASQGRTVLIIDKRPHIGGNCYDYIDEETGIRVSKYGPHFFHTNDEGVWNYVNGFGPWIRHDQKVIAELGHKYVPVPVNQETLNKIFNTNLNGTQEVKEFLATKQIQPEQEPTNSEEVALQRVGRGLYEAIFRPYTLKQWAKDPSELDASVLARIPVRDDNDCRYFTDKYQALPEEGYTSIFKKMLANPKITRILNTDYMGMKDVFQYGQIIFTGRIDSYFTGLPPLEYRSLIFEPRRYKCEGFKQRNSVVNYPSADTPYTRSIEYKWFPNCPDTPLSRSNSIVVYETSCDYDPKTNEEPYYPVPAPKNQALYEQYKALATEANAGNTAHKVHFIGRLASYKYFNMDQAIRASLDYFKEHFANNETKCIY